MAALTRVVLLRWKGPGALEAVINAFKPVMPVGLLSTLVLVFIIQGETIGNKPVHILLIMVPLIIMTVLVFAITYFIGYKVCVPHEFLAPAAMIATSNFFELAVAVAIAVYGADSGATLATVVGVLVEVPLMLCLVRLCKALRLPLEQRISTCSCDWLGPLKRCTPKALSL